MRGFSGGFLASLLALAISSTPWAGTIVINELMYHPASDTGEEEYIELYNNSGEQIDLSGWSFTAGIDYGFPSGTLLPPGSYLVIAKSLAGFASRYPDVTGTVLGPYPNRLSNSGEKVNLRNSLGNLMDTVTYADLPPWPTAADGDGPSLELRNPSLDNNLGESWAASVIGGTPGAVNSVYEATPAPVVRVLRHAPTVPSPTQAVTVTAQVHSSQGVSRVLLFSSTSSRIGSIMPGENWHFFRGRSEPAGAAQAWTALDYDDRAWEMGPTGIGYGDGDDATVLEDMQGSYLSVYLRKPFTVTTASEVRHLAFTADWDDGFVLYLNGTEVLRRGMGEPAEWVPYDRPASVEHEANASSFRYEVKTFDLSSFRDLLQDGTNILAIQCHNVSIDSSDLTIIPQLDWGAQTPFTSVEMFDDGVHGDDIAGDGVYGAALPAATQGTIVEFYAVAEDSAGREATGPQSATAANCLYQVDGRGYGDSLPHYRVVMARGDFVELLSRRLQSDELLNCTFISGESVYYRRGIRLRGSGARRLYPRSYRIEFPASEPFDLTTELNLNGYSVSRQLFAWDFWSRTGLGLPHPAYALVSLILENEHFPNYLRIESIDEDFLRRQFPGDDDGNLYRGLQTSTVEADLEYLGPAPEAYRNVYDKINNEQEDDYSDIIELTDIFSNASDGEFPARIAQAIDVPEWIGYFAVQAVLGNTEGGVHRAKGEDYFLYRRPSDGRFLILPWDADQSFGADDETVFSQKLPSVVRLIQNSSFVRLYYQTIDELLHGPFTLRAMRRPLEAYRDVVPQDDRDAIVDFVGQRRLAILEEVPQKLLYEGGTSPGDDECRRFAFASSLATIRGRANAAHTVAVRVAGEAATWHPRAATWEANLSLEPGRNEVLVEALDEGGAVFDSLLLPLFLYYGTTKVPAVLAQDQTWNAIGSPYYVTGTVSVPPGVSLRVEPGATIFLDQGASLLVEGALEALGNSALPIRLLPWRCEPWGAIGAVRAESPLRLSYCDLQQPSEATAGAYFLNAAISLIGTTAELNHCMFRDCENGVDASGHSLLVYRNGSMENMHEAFHTFHSTLWIEDSRVVNVRTYADAIDFDGDSDPPSRVSRCTFEGGQIDDGIDTSRTTVLIEDNVFCGFDADNGKALSLEGPSTPIVRGNLIHGNDVGIAIKNSCAPILEHNTIVDNGVGIDSYEKNKQRGGGSGSLLSSIVWGNDTPIRFDFFTLTDATSELEVTYSNVQGGSPPPGAGNISADPLFVNLWSRDYHLRPGSPCIGAAHDGKDMGAFYTQGTETPTPAATSTPTATGTPAPTATGSPTALVTPSPSATLNPSLTSTPTPTSTPPPNLPRWQELFELSSRWGQTTNLEPYDLEPDGTLDARDLLIFVRNW